MDAKRIAKDAYESGICVDDGKQLVQSLEDSRAPWREGPAACTNCGELAKPHPAYADFVGPFCEGCWDRLREYFIAEHPKA